MRHIPELLAPVGGLAQLYAAVNNGADAVYLGGARFNARARAENFTAARLKEAIGYAHERGVKVYVTFNTLLRDEELPSALSYGADLYDMGADAVIVQDMGLIRLLRRFLPALPLHLSTQATVYNPEGAALMKELGVRRIVPARELTIEEIREFVRACHGQVGGAGKAGEGNRLCEVEIFVHGALCMSYSGQCQMSRLLGGSEGKNGVRSGNRGLCAQPCRLPYTDDQGRTGYYLSPKDLCLLEEIPALCEAGVDSLKIEGRLKSPEYVAIVTSIYRKYLDIFARDGSAGVEPSDLETLKQIYCRGGFTRGCLYGQPGEEIFSGASPKHTGVRIGRVRSVVRDAGGEDRKAVRGAARKDAVLVDVELSGSLCEGDGVEIRPSGVLPSGTPSGGVVTYLRTIPSGARIGDMKGRISAGDGVFKVRDHDLLAKAGESFAAESGKAGAAPPDRKMARKIPLLMEFAAEAGAPARLVIREKEEDGKSGDSRQIVIGVDSEKPVERALKREADPERIREQLAKLGATPFEVKAGDIRTEIGAGCAIPVSQINRMRREGIGLLLREKRKMSRPPADPDLIRAACEELAGRRLRIPSPEEVRERFGPAVSLEDYLSGQEGIPCLFEITKGRMDAFLRENFDAVAEKVKESGIIVNNPGWIRRFQDAGAAVFGGHGLNVYNEEARLAFSDLGVEIVEASYEADLPLGGKIPLMVTEHPVKSKTLTDRKGQVHTVERAPSGDKTIIW